MKKITYLAVILLALSCKKDEETGSEPTGVYIYSAVASPTASESVTLKNNSGSSMDLTGWTLGDENNPSSYSIPSGTVLTNGQTMNFNSTTINFQINDNNETLYLKNSSGTTVDTWSN